MPSFKRSLAKFWEKNYWWLMSSPSILLLIYLTYDSAEEKDWVIAIWCGGIALLIGVALYLLGKKM